MPIEIEDAGNADLNEALDKISACAEWMSSQDGGLLYRMRRRSMSSDLISALVALKSLDVLWTKEQKAWSSPSGHDVVTLAVLPGVIDSKMEKAGALVGPHRVSIPMESEAIGAVGSMVDSLASKKMGHPPGKVKTVMIREVECPARDGLIDVKTIWHSYDDDGPCSDETLKTASHALLGDVNDGGLSLELSDLMGLLAGLGVSIDDKVDEILDLMSRPDDGSYYADLARTSAVVGRLKTFVSGWSTADDSIRRTMGDDDLGAAVSLFGDRIDEIVQGHRDDLIDIGSMRASIAALRA